MPSDGAAESLAPDFATCLPTLYGFLTALFKIVLVEGLHLPGCVSCRRALRRRIRATLLALPGSLLRGTVIDVVWFTFMVKIALNDAYAAGVAVYAGLSTACVTIARLCMTK